MDWEIEQNKVDKIELFFEAGDFNQNRTWSLKHFV
jgi:hypothetical protein